MQLQDGFITRGGCMLSRVLFVVSLILLYTMTATAESVYIVEPNPKIPQFKAIVPPDTVIPKPTCPSGWVGSIFVTPAVVSAYGASTGWNLNVISVFKTWAVDNGNGTWTAKIQVKDNKGNVFTGSGEYQRLLVETMCCPAGGNCQ